MTEKKRDPWGLSCFFKKTETTVTYNIWYNKPTVTSRNGVIQLTVLSKSAYPESEYMRQEYLFAAHRRYDGSRPARGKAKRAPVLLSREEYRKALRVALVFALIMAVVVLLLDVGSLYAGGADIDALSARIESLNSSKVRLEEDLVLAMNHPVLRRAAMEEEEDTVITLTAALPGAAVSGMD